MTSSTLRSCLLFLVSVTAAALLVASPSDAAFDKAGQTTAAPLALGSSDAPVKIWLFSDFQCSFCARIAPTVQELVERNPRRVKVVFKHFPLPIHTQAPLAHAAALAAAAQGKFWPMHDRIFANQSRLGRDHLLDHARQLGLDLDAFADAIDRGDHQSAIDRDLQDGLDLGIVATPTLFINGRKFVGALTLASLQALVDEALGLETEEEPAAALTPASFDLSGAAFKGSPSAPITIVEFSDLQCPFCAKAAPVVEELLKRYPGKLRWAFKHLPLDFHPEAPLAHQATVAAGEQGQFWEMHDAIFASQRAMARQDLLTIAARLGLNMDRFVADLDSTRTKDIVNRDLREGQRAGITGTPTFFINGTKLVGAQPIEEFEKIVQRELSTGR